MKIKMKIEIPKGSNVKYEINKKTGALEVDRILKSPMPYNYGFMPDTLWCDGDPLDLILVGNYTLHPGVEVTVEPRAVIEMFDNGDSDFKVICTFGSDDNGVVDAYKETILNYLTTYKTGVDIKKYVTDANEIQTTIQIARESAAVK